MLEQQLVLNILDVVVLQLSQSHSAVSTCGLTLSFDSRVVSAVKVIAQHIPDTYNSKSMIFLRSHSGATPELQYFSPLHVTLDILVHAIVVQGAFYSNNTSMLYRVVNNDPTYQPSENGLSIFHKPAQL